MAERSGHVSIDGSKYKIDLQTYRVKDVSDFSPRASTPGGGIIFSEMALYQPLNQTDWRHGFGFHWHEDSAGYQETVGNVDTRQSGIAMMFTAPTLSYMDAAAPTANNCFSYTHVDGTILAYGQNGVYKYVMGTGTWSVVAHFAALTVNFMWTNGTYTFACVNGARIIKSNAADLATWTDAGIDTDAADFKWMVAHDGYVYAGKDGLNTVHYGSAVDLSDLEGDDTEPATITVGPKGRAVKGAISFAGDLFFFRDDGVFKMDKDRSAARRVLDYSDQIDPYNFYSVAVYNGSMYFPIRNQLYQWNGTRVAVVTPPRINDTFPYVSYTRYDGLSVVGNFLFMTAKTSDGSYVDILCFDGVGWHRLHRFTVAATDVILGMKYLSRGSVTGGYDFLFINYTSLTAATSGIYTILLNRTSEFPYAAFATTGQHSLITSKFDAGFRRIIKSTPSILIEASNLSAGHRYLKLYYRLNNNTDWVAWGSSDGSTNIINTTGIKEFITPVAAGTLEYYWIQFRVDFVTDDAAQSPILEGMTLRLLMRPDTNYGYSFDIIVEPDFEFGLGGEINRDVATMLTALQAARDSKAPITFIDPFDVTHQVYVTAISELATEWRPEELGPSEKIDHRVSINLIDIEGN